MRTDQVRAALVATCMALFGSSALAWGAQGHRITGLIAQRLLTPEANAGIKALTGNADFAAAAVYLDVNKLALEKKIPGSREWHYDDRPVCDAKAAKAEYCPNGNCASTQITRHYRALIDQHATDDEKRFAVYTLVHLIGDVHQPLHGSDHDDRGGNDIKVQFTLPSGQKRTTNLHSAWDTDFVKATFTTTDERVIAQDLVNRFSSDFGGWQRGSTAKWLKETYDYSSTFAYGKLPGFACTSEDFGNQRLMLDDEYVSQAIGIVPEQLAKAGARIAYILNRAFAK
ncbi:S1/P1 nuclease [Roseateles sp.]|uniref:S1/P1 nuclease n=1 Tax=Roseateles sp. TaxID=1971397 RepID=UPI003D1223FB